MMKVRRNNRRKKSRSSSSSSDDVQTALYRKKTFVTCRSPSDSFFVCQLLQNIYEDTAQIRIRWCSFTDPNTDEQKINENTRFKLDYDDVLDIETILMQLKYVIHYDDKTLTLRKKDIIETYNLLEKSIHSTLKKRKHKNNPSSITKRKRTKEEVDPFFEDNISVPFISSSVQSKLAIRAVILNDAQLLQNLIDDVDRVCSVHIRRDLPKSLTAMHYAIKNENIELLEMLLKDFKEPKTNRCPFPQVVTIQKQDELMKDTNNVILSYQDQDQILAYAMENNCSREIINLLCKNFEYKNLTVCVCIRAGHRKLAASLIHDMNSKNSFSKLHYDVLSFENEDLIINQISDVVEKSQQLVTPIHCAAINPNVKYLKQLLSIIFEPNITDRYKRQPIHYAAACEGTQPLEYLLSRVDINATDKNGNSPLHIAAKYGRVKNIEILLRTADLTSINKMNKSKHYPLHLAVLHNHLDCVKILLEYNAPISTSLMLACQCGYLDHVRIFIEHGAHIESLDSFKRTPLIYACMYGHAHVVSYLLCRGVNVNVFDSSNHTALQYAIAYGWYFCVRLLLEAGANALPTTTCLMIAFIKGHYGISDYLLIEQHIDINSKTKTDDGLTLVMLTVQLEISNSSVKQLEYIVKKHHADCTCTDIHGQNAFHHLALNQCTNMSKENLFRLAKILLEHNCQPFQMNNKAQTPFILAIQSKNALLIEFFLKQKTLHHHQLTIDIDYQGRNFLHYFALNCDDELLVELLFRLLKNEELKTIVNLFDNHGRTPFHYCLMKFDEFFHSNHTKEQYQSIVKMIRFCLEILECNPDIEMQSNHSQANIFYLLHSLTHFNQIVDEHPLEYFLKKTQQINIRHLQNQQTPLLNAILSKDTHVIELLLQHSLCDINLSTIHNETPLILACKSQFLSLIKSLLSNSSCDLLAYDDQHNQALHYYVANSHRTEEYIEIFHLFINRLKSLDLNSLDNRGLYNCTPLHIAIYHNPKTIDTNNEIEQLFINSKCDLFARDEHDNLPLHYVFLNQNTTNDPIELCSLIVQAMDSKSIDVKNQMGLTPLHLAINQGWTICVLFLLERQASLSIEDNRLNTSIGMCIASNHLHMLITFLHRSIDIDLSRIYTPIEETSEPIRNPWTWKYMVDNRPKSKPIKQFSLIHLIVQRNWQGVLALVLNKFEQFHLNYLQVFEAAILNKQFDLIRRLLSSIDDRRNIFNRINSNGENIYFILAKNPFFHEKLFRILHENDIQWNISNNAGSYPIHYACAIHNKAFLTFLKTMYSTQIDFNQTDAFDNTAYGLLFWSIGTTETFDKDFLRMIISSGKSLDCLCNYENEMARDPFSFQRIHSFTEYICPYPPPSTNQFRTSPLINAIVHHNFELVKFLLELGANVNFPDQDQQTPLMYAIRQNNIDLVKLLLDPNSNKSSIDLNQTDRLGRTCIHYLVEPFPQATYAENIELLELLHQAGASLIEQDQNDLTPLNYALNNGFENLSEKLLELTNKLETNTVLLTTKPVHVTDPNQHLLNHPLDFYSKAQQYIDQYLSTQSISMPAVDRLSNMTQIGEILMDDDKNQPYDVRLTITDIDSNLICVYNFYRVQIIKHKIKTNFYLLFTRWGRIGDDHDQYQITSYSSLDECRLEFCKIFREKTGNLWERTNQFESKPKKYALIPFDKQKLCRSKDVPIDFLQLQNESQQPTSKLFSSEYKTLFKTLLNPEAIKYNLRKIQLDIERMPVSHIKSTILQQARDILKQIKQHIEQRNQLKLTLQQTTIDDTLKKHLDCICHLTNEFYSLVPIQGYDDEKLAIIDNAYAIQSCEQILTDLCELELFYKMLLAAQVNLDQESPLDYLYRSINCHFEAMHPNDFDSQLILRYIWTSSPNIHVEQIFKLEQTNDKNARLGKRTLHNHVLLWYETNICHLVNILSRGLLLNPFNETTTGQLYTKGIYTTDVFAKSFQQDGIERCFMLLCEVTLGDVQEVDSIDSMTSFDSNKYQSRKIHGQKIPDPQHTIIRDSGVQIPLGQLIENKKRYSTEYNTFIIYDESQIALRYLVQFRC